jgi:hypothetical protein
MVGPSLNLLSVVYERVDELERQLEVIGIIVMQFYGCFIRFLLDVSRYLFP